MTAMSASFVCAFAIALALPLEADRTTFPSDCACSSSSDVSVTHASTDCQTGTKCVGYVYTETGADTPGRCHVPSKCPDEGEACSHKSYTVTVQMSGCSDTCCVTTRPADPSVPT